MVGYTCVTCNENNKAEVTKCKENFITNACYKRQYNCPFLIVLLFIKVDLIVVALVSLVGYYSYEDAVYNLPAVRQEYLEDLPVYCEDLSLSPDDDDETFNKQKKYFKVSVNDDGRYVCTYRRNKIDRAIKKFVERRSRLRTAKGLEGSQYISCGNESLAPKTGYLTVTLSGVSRHQKFEGNAVDLLLHWDKHQEMSYKDPGIHYHNGEITIPEGRAYFIYASAHFRISKGQRNRPFMFSLRICRKIYGYEETLLGKSQLFNVSSRKDTGVSSLNVGSYLQMSRNDIIYVKVSDANAVIRESKGNTFGIFPL